MSPIGTYEQFVAVLERRGDISPLAWMAGQPDRKPEWSNWMLRWLREQREVRKVVG